MVEKRRCDLCNVEISKTNWSKHTRTTKHLEAVQARREIHISTKSTSSYCPRVPIYTLLV